MHGLIDIVRNALLEIATIIQRIEKLPPSKILLPQQDPPRVLIDTSTPTDKIYQAPRVKEKQSPFDCNSMKNRRATYRPSIDHTYNLRNRNTSIHPTSPAAQHITSNGTNFNSLAAQSLPHQAHMEHFINHIYDMNGKKQSIDKLLNSKEASEK